MSRGPDLCAGLRTAASRLQAIQQANGAAGELRAADGAAEAGAVAGERLRGVALLLRTVDGRTGRAVSRCVARRVRRVWSVSRGPGLCGGLRTAASRLQAIQQAQGAAGELRAADGAEDAGPVAGERLRWVWRCCCCGPWGVELGER